MQKTILVTGASGFIGFHVTLALLKRGNKVIGLDSINSYYQQKLKYDRLEECGIEKQDITWNQLVQSKKHTNYAFVQMQLEDKEKLSQLFAEQNIDRVIHLAAQPGVRYSIENPDAYIQSNIVAFLNVLEQCRHHQVKHLVYASSSSVYGLNETMPFSVHQHTDHPVSLYAATKKSNELIAHAYSHLYQIPTSALRFFTVYGSWGRPDMAYYLFTDAIYKNNPINVYNHGNMKRDFTYIDDVVKGIIKVLDKPATANPDWSGKTPDPASSKAPFRILNIGNNSPVELKKFIAAIGDALGKTPQLNMLEMQSGDVLATWADVDDLINHFDYKCDTPIEQGITEFVNWYVEYNNPS